MCTHLLTDVLMPTALEPSGGSSPRHPVELPPTPLSCPPWEGGRRGGLHVVMGSFIAVMVLTLALAVILALLACAWCFKHSNYGLRYVCCLLLCLIMLSGRLPHARANSVSVPRSSWPCAFRMNTSLHAAALSDTDTHTALHNSTIYKRYCG